MTSLITFCLIIFCFFASQLDFILAQNNAECLTPLEVAGICINLDQCDSLYSLITPNITEIDSQFLKSSQCGYVNKTVQVCCPIKSEVKSSDILEPANTTWHSAINASCVTPNKENALCIELQQCQYLFNMLSDVNITDENRQFLKSSQCGFENKTVLVCCPDHQRVLIKSKSSDSSSLLPPILPSPPNCGSTLSNRIYGGTITGIDEFPWLALIEYTKAGNAKGFHCGGALINDRYVLTAAHCTKGRSIPADWRLTGVRLGEFDITTDPDCEVDASGKSDCNSGHVDAIVEKIVAHNLYNPNSRNKQHDIALLRLATVVAMNKFIKPICLPSSTNLQSDPFTDYAMDVSGWGKTEKLVSSNVKLKATVNVWNLDKCREIYSAANISLEQTHMCAGGVEGVDSCSGDSGGPLMVQLTDDKFNVFFVAGIVSYGPVPCGRDGWPGVYTRVGAYIDWINDNVHR